VRCRVSRRALALRRRSALPASADRAPPTCWRPPGSGDIRAGMGTSQSEDARKRTYSAISHAVRPLSSTR
jgi:hypothetical protein